MAGIAGVPLDSLRPAVRLNSSLHSALASPRVVLGLVGVQGWVLLFLLESELCFAVALDSAYSALAAST